MDRRSLPRTGSSPWERLTMNLGSAAASVKAITNGPLRWYTSIKRGSGLIAITFCMPGNALGCANRRSRLGAGRMPGAAHPHVR